MGFIIECLANKIMKQTQRLPFSAANPFLRILKSIFYPFLKVLLLVILLLSAPGVRSGPGPGSHPSSRFGSNPSSWFDSTIVQVKKDKFGVPSKLKKLKLTLADVPFW